MEEFTNSSAPVSQNDEPIAVIEPQDESFMPIEDAHDVQEKATLEEQQPSPAEPITNEISQEFIEPPPSDAESELALLREELERERAMRVRGEVKLECISLLEEHKLPLSLCDILTCDSVNETRRRVTEVSRIVKEAVFEQVCAKLATIPTPSEGGHAMTVAEFKSLSLADMQRLYTTDKELYNELSRKI